MAHYLVPILVPLIFSVLIHIIPRIVYFLPLHICVLPLPLYGIPCFLTRYFSHLVPLASQDPFVMLAAFAKGPHSHLATSQCFHHIPEAQMPPDPRGGRRARQPHYLAHRWGHLEEDV